MQIGLRAHALLVENRAFAVTVEAEGTDQIAWLVLGDQMGEGLAGRWRRVLKPGSLIVDVQPFRSLTRAEIRGVDVAAEAYGAFVGLPAETRIV